MAKVRKRISRKTGETSWQIDYFDPTGKRVRQSFKKKKDAVAELGKRVSLIAENRYLDVKKQYSTTFGQLIEKYKETYGKYPEELQELCRVRLIDALPVYPDGQFKIDPDTGMVDWVSESSPHWP